MRGCDRGLDGDDDGDSDRGVEEEKAGDPNQISYASPDRASPNQCQQRARRRRRRRRRDRVFYTRTPHSGAKGKRRKTNGIMKFQVACKIVVYTVFYPGGKEAKGKFSGGSRI